VIHPKNPFNCSLNQLVYEKNYFSICGTVVLNTSVIWDENNFRRASSVHVNKIENIVDNMKVR